MKKLFTLLTITLATSFFTNANAQVRLGAQAGVILNSPTVTGLADKSNITTPTFGIIAEINAGPLLFRPSVNYLKNGFKDEIRSTLGSITNVNTQTYTFQNLEIPLDITLPVKLKSGKLLLSVAPVITVGLKGEAREVNSTQVGTAAPSVNTLNTVIQYGAANGEIKKTDWGTRFGLGYAFNNGLQINAAYKLGLTNLLNDYNDRYKAHHLMLTAAYFILGNKKK